MSRIAPEDWRPRGIEALEPLAWEALRHTGSSCVVAGPGAGKTEFLAQKAVYLFETGRCPAPYRILSISFKTDAAGNLAERVRQRCPSESAHRFVSLTFDAFTKGLVDRFLPVIPPRWRPTKPYEVLFPRRDQIRGFLDIARLNAPKGWQVEIAALSAETFESHNLGRYRLPVVQQAPESSNVYVLNSWWEKLLRGGDCSVLSFVAINRLAEVVLRANPQIRRALRATYPIVFVDEFQDTTYAQYDFLLSAFAGGSTAVTAVGDDKQKIMTWAGARPDSFVRFQRDFSAASVSLQFNYRSSKDLVRIQHVIARALDEGVVPAIAQVERDVDGDVAQVWSSPTKHVEVEELAKWLAEDMRARDRTPREYVLLVRQRADDFEADLTESFREVGLSLRNESHALARTTLQDLLADDLCRIASGLVRLAATRRAPEAWHLVSESVLTLRAVDPNNEAACRKAEADLTGFLLRLRGYMAANPPTEESSEAVADQVFEFLDLGAVARTYPEYRTGELLTIMVEAWRLHLAASASAAGGWQRCIDAFEGVDSLPLMTVHKSKGLEYDTIVFVGLDDEAWWSHTPRNPEGLATFFVALSRAKQRAIFCFCEERGHRRKVADLYGLLSEAGVPEISLPADR